MHVVHQNVPAIVYLVNVDMNCVTRSQTVIYNKPYTKVIEFVRIPFKECDVIP